MKVLQELKDILIESYCLPSLVDRKMERVVLFDIKDLRTVKSKIRLNISLCISTSIVI